MRLGPKILTAAALVLAALASWLVAATASNVIEERSGRAVSIALLSAGHTWADVDTDGLQVHIGGTAPTEAMRFNALHVAGSIVDAGRVVDGTTVVPDEPLSPPPYSIEILRNDEGITLIGLVPDTLDRVSMANEITALAEGSEVIDLLETASYPEPKGWEAAVQFGLNVLARANRSKVSIEPGAVTLTAITDSQAEKTALEATLSRRVPKDVEFRHAITAPRPVITPFTLRFIMDADGARFDACSTDTTRGRDRILQAAADAGMTGPADCRLGLGVPSAEWDNAVIQGIRAVQDLGGGSITFSDADVSLVALNTTNQRDFDRVVGELESNLPAVFSLHSVLPEPEGAEDKVAEPPEFTATLSPEGQVQLRGRLNNALVRDTVESFAKARFGVDATYTATRIDDSLPDGWPTRVLAGLQALSALENGSVVVQNALVQVRGNTGNAQAEAEIAGLLADKLGDAQTFDLDIRYVEALDPLAALPTAQECVDRINAVLAETKITFEPGSTEVEGPAVKVVDDIADILRACRKVDMTVEIAGHTDSQGREQMNLELSQKRADAVLKALMARRVLASKISAQGYGESEPIAENGTEDGREANRRIEFRLIGETETASASTDGAEAEDATAEAQADGDADAPSLDEADEAPMDDTADDAMETGADPAEDGATDLPDAVSGAASAVAGEAAPAEADPSAGSPDTEASDTEESQ